VSLSAANLVTTAYLVGNFSGFVAPKLRGEHTIFNAANCRVKLKEVPTGKVTFLNASADAAGDTFYLSYFQNEISSFRLPVPPPHGVDKCLTDALSGCMFFVDSINGSNDLIVYHANAKKHSPAGKLGGTHPITETAPAATLLNQLHADARGDYPGLVLNAAGSVNKPTYNLQAQAAADRKRGHGRYNVEFLGGTIVVGFWNAADWDFYWQTYGDTEYDRPFYAPARYTEKKHYGGADTKVLGHGQFY
jgi:hypothetical protein